MFNISQVKKCKKRLQELNRRKRLLSAKYEIISETDTNLIQAESIGSQLEELSSVISEFIENDYAEAVFNEYCIKKPDLIRVKTGETVSWNEAFGEDFSKVTNSLRHSLVGLVEEPGRYRIK